MAKQDLSICERIITQSDKDFCYSEFAFRKQDTNVCDNIINSESRDLCYRNSNQNTLPALTTGKPNILVFVILMPFELIKILLIAIKLKE